MPSRKGRWVSLHKTLTRAILDKSETGSEWLPWTCLAPTIASLRNYFRMPKLYSIAFILFNILVAPWTGYASKSWTCLTENHWNIVPWNATGNWFNKIAGSSAINDFIVRLFGCIWPIERSYTSFSAILKNFGSTMNYTSCSFSIFRRNSPNTSLNLSRRAFRASILSSGLCLRPFWKRRTRL